MSDDMVHEVRTTLDGIDALLVTTRAEARKVAWGQAPERALDTGGQPMLAPLVCAKANLLAALVTLGVPRRDETGDSGLIGSVIVLIVLAAVLSLLGLPVIEWFTTAVTWVKHLIQALADQVNSTQP